MFIVSNWGGNALAASVVLLASEQSEPEDSSLWDKCMPTDEQDIAILDAMVRENPLFLTFPIYPFS